jgi:hypothetical protein
MDTHDAFPREMAEIVFEGLDRIQRILGEG